MRRYNMFEYLTHLYDLPHPSVYLYESEYNALSKEEKNNGEYYHIYRDPYKYVFLENPPEFCFHCGDRLKYKNWNIDEIECKCGLIYTDPSKCISILPPDERFPNRKKYPEEMLPILKPCPVCGSKEYNLDIEEI